MTISHLLEDFSLSAKGSGPLQVFNKDALEELKLASFEKGYSAGWDDAVQVGSNEAPSASVALAQSIEDMSFTFQEVRTQMVASMEPFFSTLTNAILPGMASDGMNRQIVGMLSRAAEAATDQPAVLYVAPGLQEQFITMPVKDLPMRLQVVEDDCLTGSQVILRLGPTETELDGPHLLEEIRRLVETFMFEAKEELKVG